MDSVENVLTITERPYPLWFTGAMFGGFGLMMLLQGESSFLMGIIFLLIGAFLVINSPIITASLDRSRNTMVLHTRSLLRQRVREIRLTDVMDIEVQRSRGGRGGKSFRLAFVLQDGTIVPITNYYSGGRASKTRQAEQIRQFLELETPRSGPPTEPRFPLPYLHPSFQTIRRGETNGVTWQIESGGSKSLPITRWSSPATGIEDGFLLLAQKPPRGMELPGGLLSGLTGLAYRQLLQIYGFESHQLPGFDSARVLDAVSPDLDPFFSTYTAQPEAVRRLLNAWVVQPLRRWAEQHPMQAVQASDNAVQLVVLFHPGGTELGVLNQPPKQQQALVDLGVELVRESGGR